MPWRPVDHTADIGVEVWAASEEELYAEALVAFFGSFTDLERVGEDEARSFELVAADRELLLVDWLSELLACFEIDGLLLRRASEVEVGEAPGGGRRLRAVTRGERYDPDRHGLRLLIKAVTYHELRIWHEEETGTWRARVIFDI